jgi:7-cyano-7-deazaguanine synthase in queuosine biosynthesis
MRLIAINKTSQPNGATRVTGQVQYNDNFIEDYWFEVPSEYEPSSSGNPWLAILLPIAATLGEDLHIPLSVDPELMRGAESVLRLWAHWREDIHVISIVSGPLRVNTFAHERTAASFFSAGVDSTFTVLRRPDVRHWVTVQGFDMPISKTDEFEQHCARLKRMAEHYGATFVAVRTNIRETRWRKAHWEAISHGPALAAVALMFENHFHETLVPASYDYSSLDPWGSHPLSDPLFSTVHTKVVHEGTAYTRTEKIEYLTKDQNALRELHVCYRGEDSKGQDHRNCCRCEKCYRTMIALDLFGKLDEAALFERRKFDIKRIAKIYISHKLDEKFFENLYQTSVDLGRHDIAEQIAIALRRSKHIKRLTSASKLPLLWRPAQALTRHLLRDSPR